MLSERLLEIWLRYGFSFKRGIIMNNINAFALSHDEKIIFAGTLLGEIWLIDVDEFKIQSRVGASYGAINAVAMHPSKPYVAVHCEDNWLIIYKYDKDNNKLNCLHTIRSRNIKPEDDPYVVLPSTSQCLCFHSEKLRIAGHGGTTALFELEFDDESYNIIHTSRLHGAYDVITARYHDSSNKLLSGASNGEIVLSENGKIIKSWQQEAIENQKTVHWFEPYGDNTYICASDTGRLIYLDIDNGTELCPWFARDHMEHVTVNAASKKIYASSFDRNVHEISPTDFDVNNVAWAAPFKLRWIKSLSDQPHILIVQCRNGGLYKVDISVPKGRVLAVIKNTPDALWSGVVHQQSVVIAGEGDYYFRYTANDKDLFTNQLKFSVERFNIPGDPETYTKRIAVSPGETYITFARTDGELIVVSQDKFKKKIDLGSAVRDICFAEQENIIYAATESGHVYAVDIESGKYESLYHSKSPIWALAYNPTHKLVAFAHRFNRIYFIDTKDNTLATQYHADLREYEGLASKFIKRIRWSSTNNLFIGYGGGVAKYDLRTNKSENYLPELLPNTVEDFSWDGKQRYFIAVNYSRQLFLCEFTTGEIISVFDDYSDYTKGILMLDNLSNDPSHAADLITFGRYQHPRYNRINNDRIINVGDIN